MIDMPQLFWMFSIGCILVFIIGIYCVLVTANLIRAIIGMELLTKAVTLFLILAGYVTGRTGMAQAFAITLIVIEVVIIAIAVGISLSAFRHNKSIHAEFLRNIKD
jgi:multisubunit Na+/H+ antiporter MnhC subunit